MTRGVFKTCLVRRHLLLLYFVVLALQDVDAERIGARLVTAAHKTISKQVRRRLIIDPRPPRHIVVDARSGEWRRRQVAIGAIKRRYGVYSRASARNVGIGRWQAQEHGTQSIGYAADESS